ncbi:glutamate-1-semialdehyde 2,1-aminomutase [candidate division GN15 bacterium]|nr:glutamate-1-semialdehyde 2,1-aminomutase [candidate division GN15 bacterium]
MSSTERSQGIFRKSEQVIPGGVNSPVRAFRSVDGVPRVINRAEGAYIWDVDGKRYLDFCCSWGPLILGHADPDVMQAIREQTTRGISYGAPTEVEYELASFIVNHVECIEKIRFVSSGTEAVMSAIRAARGFTGRDLVVKYDGCYHGHCDHLLVSAGSGLATFGQPSSDGVPGRMTADTAVLPLDDESALSAFFADHGDRVAAVIIEGIPANDGLLVQRHEYVRMLRALTETHGALLILDEVITGFRVGMGGAAEYYGIVPDLVTYGKIIGGGMPVGAFGGRADVMDVLSPLGGVYQAGTLSGNPVAMTAGLTTLQKLADGSVHAALEKRNRQFVTRLMNHLDRSAVNVVGVGSIFWIVFQRSLPRAAAQIDPDGIAHFNRMHERVLQSGIYLPPSGYEVCFLSTAHDESALDAAADTMGKIISEEAHAWV